MKSGWRKNSLNRDQRTRKKRLIQTYQGKLSFGCDKITADGERGRGESPGLFRDGGGQTCKADEADAGWEERPIIQRDHSRDFALKKEKKKSRRVKATG